jgi:hypothetical protein
VKVAIMRQKGHHELPVIFHESANNAFGFQN